MEKIGEILVTVIDKILPSTYSKYLALAIILAISVYGLFRFIVFMDQNNITKALLRYEERKKYRHGFNMFVIGVFVVICFSVGLLAVGIGSQPQAEQEDIMDKVQSLLQEDKDEEVLEILRSISQEEKRKIRTDTVQGEQTNSNIAIEIGVIFVLLVIPLLASLYLKHEVKKRDNERYGNSNNTNRNYFSITLKFYFAFLIMEINYFVSISIHDIDNYLIYGSGLSFAFGASLFSALLYINGEWSREVSQVKIQYRGKELYLYGVEGENYIASDSRILAESKEYYLINKSEFKGPFINTDNPRTEVQDKKIIRIKKDSNIQPRIIKKKEKVKK